jgi:hypothetical protein
MHQALPHPAPSLLLPRAPHAVQALSGEKGFLTKARLSRYAEKRNDPTIPNALSGLSPYLHFGHLSAQRAAIEAAKNKAVHKVGRQWVALVLLTPPVPPVPLVVAAAPLWAWVGWLPLLLLANLGLKKHTKSHPCTVMSHPCSLCPAGLCGGLP